MSHLLGFVISGEAWVAIAVVGVLLSAMIFFILLNQRYVKVGPNEALVVSGWGRTESDASGRRLREGFKIVTGGGTFVWPVFQRAEILSLEVMTIDVKTPEVQSLTGMPVIVEGVAQIKVKGDDASIKTAAQFFLSKTQAEIMNVALHTLEGHLRAIIGTMTIEDLFQKREVFAQRVQEVSATDFRHMGLEVVSLVMKEIRDTQGYLETLAKLPMATMSRDAAVRQAEMEKETTMKSAEARREGQQKRFEQEQHVAQAERDYEVKRQSMAIDVNTKKAEADRSYDIRNYQMLQQVKVEEIKVMAVEKESQIKVQEMEIQRRQKELDATIRKPAEAQKFQVETLADAERYRIEANAMGQANAERNLGIGQADALKARGIAEADVQRAQGLAQAEVILAKGQAEAEAMRKKAEAWRAYNEAAVAQMFIEKLPEIARAVAEPLGKIDKITLINSGGGDGIGASKIAQEVINIVTQLPPILEGVAGINLKELIQNLPKLGGGKKEDPGTAKK